MDSFIKVILKQTKTKQITSKGQQNEKRRKAKEKTKKEINSTCCNLIKYFYY